MDTDRSYERLKKLHFYILLIVMLILMGCARVSEISLDNVQSITMYGTDENGGLLCTDEQIQSFVEAYNQATLYTNDAGTTHPCRVEIIFQDETTMRVWGGTQSFCTIASEATGQQNIQSQKLDKWFSDFVSDNE